MYKVVKTLISLVNMAVLLLLFLSHIGCRTREEYEKISDKEKSQILAFAENVIKNMPDNKITPEQRQAISTISPVVSISYTDDKAGKYTISWKINHTIITYVGIGDLTSPESSFSKINIVSVEAGPLKR